MKQVYLNEQDSLVDDFILEQDLTAHQSHLAFFRISSYKLAKQQPSYAAVAAELRRHISQSLLRYRSPRAILFSLPDGLHPGLN